MSILSNVLRKVRTGSKAFKRVKRLAMTLVPRRGFFTSHIPQVTIISPCFIDTLEPRFNEGPRNWPNMFEVLLSRFFSIHFTITGVENIVCYIEFPL